MGKWLRSYAFLHSTAAALMSAAAVLAVIEGGHAPRGAERFVCGESALTESQLAAKFGVSVETLQKARFFASVTNEDLCQMPAALRTKALRKGEMPKPDHPGEAVEFRRLSLQSDDGTIPDGALLRAKAQLDAFRADPARTAPNAGLTAASWTSLGPGNIGGRIRSMLINPNNPAVMLVGSVSGGIWKTTNTGASWSPVQDFMANLAVSTMVAQPNNFTIQYAGTGEGFYNVDGIRGAGIFKSTNGGTTWTQLAVTDNSNYRFVNRLAMSPDSSTLLAATRSGVYRSTDGGASFTTALTGVSLGAMDVDFHPTDSQKAVVGGHEGKAWYSTDGGQSFTLASGLPSSNGAFRRVETAYAPSSPNIVYAAIDLSGGSLYKSVDGGQSYVLVLNGSPDWLGGQGWYDNTLFVDPTNPDFLIVGGIDLYRSTTGGTSFSRISNWAQWPASAHADHHNIATVPGFNGTTVKGAFFVNDGGIYGTTDIYTVGNNPNTHTNGWQEYNNGLAITQFYGAGAHEASGKVMGGTQDNGTLTYTQPASANAGFEDWVFEFGGDGGWSAIDQTNPNYCYGEYVYLQIHRSTTGCGANSGDWIDGGLGDAGVAANFIAPFILDPNEQARLLAGGASLWRTNDARAASVSWSAIKPPISPVSYISAIAVQPSPAAVVAANSNNVWVGHNNGNVYKTTNGLDAAPTWTQVDNGANPLPNRQVTRVAVDYTNVNVVYATFGGFATDNIWKSTNGGTNWTNIHGAIPSAPVRSIVLNPTNPSFLYVGTEIGIFTSEDGGTSWSSPHVGPSNVSVDEVFFSGSTLYAATHGRGVYKANLGATETRIISLSGDLNFGNVVVGQTPQRTLTISNTGNAPLTVSSISYPSGFGGAFSGSIPAGGAQNVTVTFAPMTGGNHGGTVTVNANHTSGTNTTTASGFGLTRIISLSGNLAFGEVQVGETSTRILTITNLGNSPLEVTSIGYTAGFSGPFAGTIAASGSQSLPVTFAPTATGNVTGTVTVNANQTSGGNTTNASGAGVLFTKLIVSGLAPFPNNGGWVSVRRDLDNVSDVLSAEAWLQVPWEAYNANGGGVHAALGSVDADGYDEVVLGLTSGGQGWIAILDDALHGYALLAWMQVPWTAYNAANGEVYPAVGDIDGDGIGEIIAGLGPGAGGWFAIFEGQDGAFNLKSWQRVNWPAYNTNGDGSTHPAVADVDRDHYPDIVLGLGAGSGGWLEIKEGDNNSFGTKRWIQVSWPAYNAASGTTYPAAHGEMIAIGLGQGSGGWVEVVGGGSTHYAHARWLQVSWPAYNNANGETHPALGNLNAAAGPELVVGLSAYAPNGGWFEVINPITGASLGWMNVDWAAYTNSGGGLWPAIGKLK